MCGILGWIDWRRNLLEQALVMEQMTESLAARGPDGSGIRMAKEYAFGHRRLSVMDPANGAQPMVYQGRGKTCVITYNGELYNAPDLRAQLESCGHMFRTTCDTEVLLLACVEWGVPTALAKLNGIFAFAFWDEQSQSGWLARDRLGVKPLFFAHLDEALVFASEMKTLLLHPDIRPEVDAEGMAEIWGIGPARTPGHGVFRQIRELRPGHVLEFTQDGLRERAYWRLTYTEHHDDEPTTVARVTDLLTAAVRRQLAADVPLGSLLSGGLDSSALTALAVTGGCPSVAGAGIRGSGLGAESAAARGLSFRTFSVDYEEQSQFFQTHPYQPESDAPFIAQMVAQLGTEHHFTQLRIESLVETLEEAMRARDLPGMADIDASLLLFCREIKKIATVAISGEAADELFAGYPWFFHPDRWRTGAFPWAPAVDVRAQMLTHEAGAALRLEEYVRHRYEQALAEVPHPSATGGGREGANETTEERWMRSLSYLNITRFMPTLLDRKDRMSMACGLEVRVPFCDHELVEYVFQVPWKMKYANGREKGLLRAALRGVLPEAILQRKKSPYPKTHHPLYSKLVREALQDVLADPNAPIRDWIDVERVRQLAASPESDSLIPWFGQLMSGPQFFAYLLQVNAWLRTYRVRFV